MASTITDVNDQFITLADEPILIDAEGELYEFLTSWFDPCMLYEVFQPRKKRTYDKSRVEATAFEEFLPPLPDLKINQYQIPTGFSRYSRGLFLVDKITLAKIAWKAFNVQPNTNPPTYQQLAVRFPYLFEPESFSSLEQSWGENSFGVPLKFKLEHTYEETVMCLRPIRVPYESRDVYLLPVVEDKRYEHDGSMDINFNFLEHGTNHIKYSDLFKYLFENVERYADAKVVTRKRYPTFTLRELGVPHRSIRNRRKDLACMLDAMAFTIGYRYVPRYGMMNLATSTSLREYQTQFEKMGNLIIAGGFSGICDLPDEINVHCRKARDWFDGYDWTMESQKTSPAPPVKDDTIAAHRFPSLHNFSWENKELGQTDLYNGKKHRINSLWTVNVPTSDGSSEDTTKKFEDFVNYWVGLHWLPWLRKDYVDITYAGIPKPINEFMLPNEDPDTSKLSDAYFLTGFDNWAIIDLGFGQGGQNKITTRIQSMPQTWFPPYLTSMDPEDITHYGPAYFISEQCIPRARKMNGGEFKLGRGKAYFMVLCPDPENIPPAPPQPDPAVPPDTQFKLKKTNVYAYVYNTLGSVGAKENWPMQAKFIGGVWCIDVAECC